MNIFELYISYISWGNDGKHRPVLVFSLENDIASVYSVTSKYDNKSSSIQKEYFKITDWQQAGLDKQSYVDTIDYFDVPVSLLEKDRFIGRLTKKDKERFIEFLTK